MKSLAVGVKYKYANPYIITQELYFKWGGISTKTPFKLRNLNLETIIPVDDSVRLLSQFVEAMELNCKRDINFMYLLEGKPVPDYATFARFRSIHLHRVRNGFSLKCLIFFMSLEKFPENRFL